jgi:hypothetical protein
MAQAAEIIDLAQFRNRRQAAEAPASGQAMVPAFAPFAAPFLWMPVWVFIGAWPASA